MNSRDLTKKLISDSLKDIKVELDDEFDKNFTRKAFFSRAWQRRKRDDGKGSLLIRKGNLRRSIRSRLNNTRLAYSSSQVYAAIHNEGGEITITKKMKRFFWAKYYEAAGGVTYSVNTKSMNNTKRNRGLTDEAEFFKSMALKRVGDKIVIPQRQFIGSSRETDKIIREIVDSNIQSLVSRLAENFKTK